MLNADLNKGFLETAEKLKTMLDAVAEGSGHIDMTILLASYGQQIFNLHERLKTIEQKLGDHA